MASKEVDISVLKRGEQVLSSTVSRVRHGLRISTKTQPAIEDLIKSWSMEEACSVAKWGRGWESPQELKTRDLTHNPGIQPIDGGGYYCLDRVGRELFETRPVYGSDGRAANQEVFNMSFLRLVGISSGAGVEFTVRGVFTPQTVRKVAELIKFSAKTIFLTYLKPIDVTVMVLTQPWQGDERSSNGL